MVLAREWLKERRIDDDGRRRLGLGSQYETMRQFWHRTIYPRALTNVMEADGKLSNLITFRKLACLFIRRTMLDNGKSVFDIIEDDDIKSAVAAAESFASGSLDERGLSDAHQLAELALGKIESLREKKHERGVKTTDLEDAIYHATKAACMSAERKIVRRLGFITEEIEEAVRDHLDSSIVEYKNGIPNEFPDDGFYYYEQPDFATIAYAQKCAESIQDSLDPIIKILEDVESWLDDVHGKIDRMDEAKELAENSISISQATWEISRTAIHEKARDHCRVSHCLIIREEIECPWPD